MVEWLPQETIIFPEAHAQIATRVRLNAESRFIGWEMACYGRPASGLLFESGHVAQDFELWVEGVPLLLDHLRLDGAAESMRAPFGLAGQPVSGTLLAYPADSALLESVRGVLAEGVTGEAAPGSPSIARRLGAVTSACSCVDGVLVCRAVASQADAVRRVFMEIWRRIRPTVAGRAAVAPRIWAT
jgi:urease accessory protein